MPKTILRIPDCSLEKQKPIRKVPAVSSEKGSSSGKKRWFFRTGLAFFWMSGVCAGFLGAVFFHFCPALIKNRTPVEYSGEYVVSEIDEFSETPISEMAQAPVQEKFVAISPVDNVNTGPIPEWDNGKYDALDSIPPWRPEEETGIYADDNTAEEAAPFSFKNDNRKEPRLNFEAEKEYFDSADLAVTGNSAREYESPVTDGGPRDFTEPDTFVSDEAAAAVPQEFAQASDRPMKNQVEYFEPFETAGFPDTKAESVRMAASEDFYRRSPVGSFSDYVPPRYNSEDR